MKSDRCNIYIKRLLKGHLIKIIKLYFVISAFSLFFSEGLLGVMSVSCTAFAKENFRLSRRENAFGIQFLDKKSGWIVGDNSFALKTEDGGNSWQRVFISEDDTFNDVFFIGEKGWIVGGSGLILHTDDGGKVWNRQSATDERVQVTSDSLSAPVEPLSSVSQTLMDVFFIDQNKGITVGADGTIARTENGGQSWHMVSLDWTTLLPLELVERGVVSLNFYDVLFLNDTCGWIVGDWGAIVYTADGGRTWTLSHIGSFPPLFSIAFENNKEGWAVGQNGFVLKTDNGGETWNKFSIGTENSLYRIQFNGEYGVTVGDQATMLKTNDAGQSWTQVDLDLRPPYPWLADTCIIPGNPAKILTVGKGIVTEIKISSRR